MNNKKMIDRKDIKRESVSISPYQSCKIQTNEYKEVKEEDIKFNEKNKETKLYRFVFCGNINGYYDIFRKCLESMGYFRFECDDDILVSLGDMFDYGPDSYKVYKFLRMLENKNRAIILRGDRENEFISFLERDYDSILYAYRMNGFDSTLIDFASPLLPFDSWFMVAHSERKQDEKDMDDFYEWCDLIRDRILESEPDILEWLKALPYYMETEKYIATHANLDYDAKDFGNPSKPWEDLVCDGGVFFNKVNKKLKDKKVIISGVATKYLRMMYERVLGDYQKKPRSTIGQENSVLYSAHRLNMCVAVNANVADSNIINMQIYDDFIEPGFEYFKFDRDKEVSDGSEKQE